MMDDGKYEIGDVVILKSSGPLLTVTDTDKKGLTGPVVSCRWFTAQGQLAEDSFDPNTIRLLVDEDLECVCEKKPRARSPEELLKELGRNPEELVSVLSATLASDSRWAERAELLGQLARDNGASATVIHDILTSR